MALGASNIYRNVSRPAETNVQRQGKGNWKIAGDAGTGLIYSTDNKNWFRLVEETSPVVLYNTELYLDTATSVGEVNKLPDEIIPRYVRDTEKKSSMKQDKEAFNKAPISPDEYYKNI
tara:strand:- start:93 stop:446 length:354 start_codon:yes stop_codon:yes gene_type:complete